MTSETKVEATSDTTGERPRDLPKSRRQGRGAVALSLAWLAGGIPLLWGVVQTLRRSLALFG